MRPILTLVVIFLFPIVVFGQSQILKGKVVDAQNNDGIASVGIQLVNTEISTQTDSLGFFSFKVPQQNEYQLKITHVSYIDQLINVSDNEILIQLQVDNLLLKQVNVSGQTNELPKNSLQKLKPLSVNETATPFNEFNQLITTLPGVVSNNELSSAYAVRGGNFDENLVYVNGMEIYRPFLVRAGQQEGLSFINPDLVGNIEFSAGGWEAKYGDKLSSNLLIDYKKTEETEGNVNVGLLGASAYLSTQFNKKDNLLLGLRYKNAKYLFNTFETSGEYLPRFLDFQAFYNYRFSDKTSLDLLAVFAQNDYRIEPASRETDLGTLQQKLRFFVAYEGAESLRYQSFQGGARLRHLFSDNFRTSVILSAFSTSEYEYNNTEGFYRLCDVDQDFSSDTFDQCISLRGIGANYNYARNFLYAQVAQAIIRNDWQIQNNHLLAFGFEYKKQFVNDFLDEFEFRDSADYAQVNRVIKQENNLEATFANVYVQHEWQLNNRHSLNYGLRVNYGSNTGEWLLSPRLQYQVLLHPDKSGKFSFSTGFYRQFPFYRELRDFSGNITPNVRAQSALHFVGNYSKNLELWNRPFQINSALYYKYLYDIIPFDVDNIRLRYRPDLTANGYAYGADFRFSGEFIPDMESWFSLGLLSTRENVEEDSRGYIRRPTDQRVTAAIFFQDNFINDPSLKVNLKLQVGSGLPFGPPNSLENRNIFNGEWYRRMDIGFSKQFMGDRIQNLEYIESFWIGLDVLNVLGVSNTISYSWIEDVNGQTFAIPNSLSARFLNLKGIVKF
ncbi:TonB-dependent receptor [Marivirga sp.]|uniref:TonB-dependent receptor n=1 Tax=Marivirga sp. TaxID=2018662 RepID=UPI002D7F5C49|nr:carboxypeptidase-like regulatory domain-containing protein [Marivirga sp.]HET8860584.1 carboxypeptidase-like regulatory domain-containing protein [Marivirga sp.]